MDIKGPKNIEEFLKNSDIPDFVDEKEDYPWDDPKVREDVRRQINYRPSEPTKLKLEWLKKKRKIESINSFVDYNIEVAVERELRKAGVYDANKEKRG
jgi:hypothetical protein